MIIFLGLIAKTLSFAVIIPLSLILIVVSLYNFTHTQLLVYVHASAKDHEIHY
jgi:hypothetical protein